ncbi:MAG: type V CRISPR-associated protein Cas12a/Cpf1, partial [Mangrovibacterium sp.]
MKNFTNLFKQSKTLRFELKPVGKTLENINKAGFIAKDEKRNEDYKVVKKIMDDYHRDFIENALKLLSLSSEELQNFAEAYRANEDKKGEEAQKNLRAEVVKGFGKQAGYGNMFKGELISADLPLWMKRQEGKYTSDDLAKVESFSKFTTYFSGFNENRKNIYSGDEQSTAIAHRIVHENLPKFLDNLKSFEYIKKHHPTLSAELAAYYEGSEYPQFFDGISLDDVFSVESFNHMLNQSGIEAFNNLLSGISHDEHSQRTHGLNEKINLYNQTLGKNEQGEKIKKAPKLTMLYKQILSDRSSLSFVFEEIKDDAALLDMLAEFKDSMDGVRAEAEKVNDAIKQANPEQVYIDRACFSDISSNSWGNYSVIRTAVLDSIPKLYEKSETAQEKLIKTAVNGVISFAELDRIVQGYLHANEEQKKFDGLASYFAKGVAQREGVYSQVFEVLDARGKEIDVLLTSRPEKLEQTDKTNIQAWLDSQMDVLHFYKPLHLRTKMALEKDAEFYSLFDELFQLLGTVVAVYNKTRNHLSKKPYSVEKVKLNFE